MQSVLPGIGRPRTQPHDPPNGRSVIYDPKGDIYGMLLGMGLSCPIELLNPFDSRAVAWNCAADIPDLATGQTIIEKLFPSPKGDKDTEAGSFFRDALQSILTMLVEALIQRFPNDWTFRQLMLLAFSSDHTRAVLASYPSLLRRYNDLVSNEETARNLQATILVRMAPGV